MQENKFRDLVPALKQFLESITFLSSSHFHKIKRKRKNESGPRDFYTTSNCVFKGLVLGTCTLELCVPLHV